MSDLTVQERIERAHVAQRLLEDPVLGDAIRAAQEEVVERWLDTDKPDPERAVAAWATRKALDLVKENLRRSVSDGQIAAAGASRAK